MSADDGTNRSWPVFTCVEAVTQIADQS